MIDQYVRQFEAFAGNGGGLAPAWLRTLRQGAIDEFRRTGFPSTRDEEWRFTSVAPIVRSDFRAAPAAAPVLASDLEPFLFERPEWPRLVFVDGRYRADLSRVAGIAGVTVTTIAEALGADPALLEAHFGQHVAPAATPFTALNTALAPDGALIRVSRGAVMDQPIHLLFVASREADGVAAHPRALVVVEAEARTQLVESYVSLSERARYLTNTVCEIAMGEGSWLEHSRIQRESEGAYHIGFTEVDQRRDSHYRSFSLAMGGSIARHNLHTRLGAPNTEALLYGLYLGRGDQLIDNHTTIFHDEPNCRSWEIYKGVLDERAHGVFNGKILVRPEAQKTDAKQTNRALLLSDSARIDTKPQLEIFADDVKCTHGATVGNLDRLSGFYLRSRGIPEEVARRMLIGAFAAEVVDEIASEPVRVALDRIVRDWLGVEVAGAA